MEKQWFQKNKKNILGVVTVVLVFFFMKYILTLVMPFFIALCLVAGAQPIFQWLEEKLHIKKKVIAILVLVLGSAVIGIAFWYIMTSLCEQISLITRNIEVYQNEICRFIHFCCQVAQRHMGYNATVMEDTIFFHVNNFTADIKRKALPQLMNYSVAYVKIILAVVAFLAITVIATILLAKDFSGIRVDLRRYGWYRSVEDVGSEIGRLAARYMKAQGMIMGTVSIVSGTVLWIVGIHNGFVIGILTGLLDALPFIGTGIVLLPMALWQLVQGNGWRCLGIFLLYIGCILLRELLEPKLIGKEMDIYPVVVLLSIYTGIQLYGLAGVALGPLSFLLIREIWRKLPDLEKERADFCEDD